MSQIAAAFEGHLKEFRQLEGLSCRITTASAYIDTCCFFLVSCYFFAGEEKVCRPIWFSRPS